MDNQSYPQNPQNPQAPIEPEAQVAPVAPGAQAMSDEPTVQQPESDFYAASAPESIEEAGEPVMSDQPVVEGAAEQTIPQSAKTIQPFSWQAPEGVHHARSVWWYILFAVVAAGLMALAIFVFESLTFAVLVGVMVVSVILLTGKPPRTINYGISSKGIYVADQLHDYSEFRAFGVVQDPGYLSIIVLPVKRFATGLTLYFGEEDGERIVDLLGSRLPLQEIKPDALEKIIRIISSSLPKLLLI